MSKAKPIGPAATSMPPEDELATRPTDPDGTAVLRRLTVQEVEQRLLNADDETRTDIQPILESPDPSRS
jgi:hypothetical protein